MIPFVVLHCRLATPGKQIGDCKALGVFSTFGRAERALQATATKPGFRDGDGAYQVIALTLDQDAPSGMGLGGSSGSTHGLVASGDAVALAWRRIGGTDAAPFFLPCGVYSDVESARRELPWGDDFVELGAVVADLAQVDRVEWASGFGGPDRPSSRSRPSRA